MLGTYCKCLRTSCASRSRFPTFIVGGNEPDFRLYAGRPHPCQHHTSLYRHSPTTTEMGTIRTVQTVDVAGENTYPTAIVAIRGFGFTLGTDQNGEPFLLLRGRYLRKLTFLVRSGRITIPWSGLWSWKRRPDFGPLNSAYATNSTVQYTLLPTVLQFAEASSGAQSVVGTVCHSSERTVDVFFSCGIHLSNGFQSIFRQQDSDMVQTGGSYLTSDTISDQGPVLSPVTK